MAINQEENSVIKYMQMCIKLNQNAIGNKSRTRDIGSPEIRVLRRKMNRNKRKIH